MKKVLSSIILGSILLLNGCSISKNEIDSKSENSSENNSVESNESTNTTLGYLEKLLRTPKESKGQASYECYLSDETFNFMFDLVNRAYTNENENIALAPVSVYMALSLASECAPLASDTRNEILKCFGYENNSHGNIEQVKRLYEHLNNSNKDGMIKELSNSVWLQQGMEFNDECLDTLANDYYCYPFAVDFVNENQLANQLMQEFIYEKTHHLINLNPQLKPETLLALMNTLYIKDIWSTNGDLKFSDDEIKFYNYDGSKKEEKFLLTLYIDGKIYENDLYRSFQAITNSGMKLKVALPKEGVSVDELFKDNILYDINRIRYQYSDELYEYHTRLELPKFTASYDGELKGALQDMGIQRLFGPADLSNICPTTPAAASGVHHVTKYIVDEKGTEGAAVTIIPVEATSVAPTRRPVYETLLLNKSFVYMLTTVADVPLFIGAIKTI